MGWLQWNVNLWGDPDLTNANSVFDFNTAIELQREFLGALVRVAGNVPNVKLGEARFEQHTDDRRYGRLLVLPMQLGIPIVDEPWIVLPYSTASATGVQIHADIITVFPDGSSSDAGTIIAPGNSPF